MGRRGPTRRRWRGSRQSEKKRPLSVDLLNGFYNLDIHWLPDAAVIRVVGHVQSSFIGETCHRILRILPNPSAYYKDRQFNLIVLVPSQAHRILFFYCCFCVISKRAYFDSRHNIKSNRRYDDGLRGQHNSYAAQRQLGRCWVGGWMVGPRKKGRTNCPL